MTILLLIGLVLIGLGGLLLSRKWRLSGFASLAAGLLIAGCALLGPGDPLVGAAANSVAPSLGSTPPDRAPAPSPSADPSRIVVCPGDPRCPKQ
jgi:hypothetical protein